MTVQSVLAEERMCHMEPHEYLPLGAGLWSLLTACSCRTVQDSVGTGSAFGLLSPWEPWYNPEEGSLGTKARETEEHA